MNNFNKDIKINLLPAVPNINVHFYQKIIYLCKGKGAVIKVDETNYYLSVCWINQMCARRGLQKLLSQDDDGNEKTKEIECCYAQFYLQKKCDDTLL